MASIRVYALVILILVGTCFSKSGSGIFNISILAATEQQNFLSLFLREGLTLVFARHSPTFLPITANMLH